MLQGPGDVRHEGMQEERYGRHAPDQRPNDISMLPTVLYIYEPEDFFQRPCLCRSYNIWGQWINHGIALMVGLRCGICPTLRLWGGEHQRKSIGPSSHWCNDRSILDRSSCLFASFFLNFNPPINEFHSTGRTRSVMWRCLS